MLESLLVSNLRTKLPPMPEDRSYTIYSCCFSPNLWSNSLCLRHSFFLLYHHQLGIIGVMLSSILFSTRKLKGAMCFSSRLQEAHFTKFGTITYAFSEYELPHLKTQNMSPDLWLTKFYCALLMVPPLHSPLLYLFQKKNLDRPPMCPVVLLQKVLGLQGWSKERIPRS